MERSLSRDDLVREILKSASASSGIANRPIRAKKVARACADVMVQNGDELDPHATWFVHSSGLGNRPGGGTAGVLCVTRTAVITNRTGAFSHEKPVVRVGIGEITGTSMASAGHVVASLRTGDVSTVTVHTRNHGSMHFDLANSATLQSIGHAIDTACGS